MVFINILGSTEKKIIKKLKKYYRKSITNDMKFLFSIQYTVFDAANFETAIICKKIKKNKTQNF